VLIQSAEAAARALGVRLSVFDVDAGRGVAPVFERIAAARVDALIVPPSIFFNDRRRQIIARSRSRRCFAPIIRFCSRFATAERARSCSWAASKRPRSSPPSGALSCCEGIREPALVVRGLQGDNIAL
jgi:hypothetical protein